MITWPKDWNHEEGWRPTRNKPWLTKDSRKAHAFEEILKRNHGDRLRWRVQALGGPTYQEGTPPRVRIVAPRICFEELQVAVKKLGISSCVQYVKRYHEIPGAPAHPRTTYKQWVSWPDFFGRQQPFLSLDQLRQEVLKRGVKTAREYRNRNNEIDGAPRCPSTYYPEWESWHDLFGRGPKVILTLAQLKNAVQELGIRSSTEYKYRLKEIPGAPVKPEKYADWVGWPDLFGRKLTPKIPIDTLQETVRALGIRGPKEYRRRYKEIPGAPSYPESYPEWNDWFSFLGISPPQRLPLDQLKTKVQELGINTSTEYQRRRKEIPGAPATPQRVYEEWVDWPDLFGRASLRPREHITLSELKLAVAKLEVSSINGYQKRRLEIPGAPARPNETYPDWVSWPELFGLEVPVRIPFKDLKIEVQRLGITSYKEYEARYKEIYGARRYPSYGNKEWVSWKDLFGRAPTELIPFLQLKQEVHRLGIRSVTEYRSKKRYREIPGAPSDPQLIYEEWVSWPDLFGRPKAKLIPLEQLQREVSRRRILTSDEYRNRYREISGARAAPAAVYKNWAGWPSFFRGAYPERNVASAHC